MLAVDWYDLYVVYCNSSLFLCFVFYKGDIVSIYLSEDFDDFGFNRKDGYYFIDEGRFFYKNVIEYIRAVYSVIQEKRSFLS